jgi:hypothetical protein
MFAGLVLDAQRGALELLGALDSLCGAPSAGWLGTLWRHWQLLPTMHLGMVAGAVAGACLAERCAPPTLGAALGQAVVGLRCSVWMMAGMTLAGHAWAHLPAAERAAVPVVTAIFAGMLPSMLAGMFLGMYAGRWVDGLLVRWQRRAPRLARPAGGSAATGQRRDDAHLERGNGAVRALGL